MFVNGFQNYMMCISKPHVSVPSAGKPAWCFMKHVSSLLMIFLQWSWTRAFRPLLHSTANCPSPLPPLPSAPGCMILKVWMPSLAWGTVSSLPAAWCLRILGSSFFKFWNYVLILTSTIGEKSGDLMVEETELCLNVPFSCCVTF